MEKSQLEQHYLETTYSVFINEQQYDIKITEPVPSTIKEIVKQTKEKSAAILTAWNPRSEPFSLEENKTRNDKLKITLQNNNFTILNALGQGNDSSWPAEESFFIAGITKQEAEKLAVDYEQYAYVWLDSEKPVSLVFSAIWYE